MKKTYNINLAGMPFVIDEDAYTMFSQYLDTIAHLYRDSEANRELELDIETRAAELFREIMGDSQCIITLQMTEMVINRIGQPEEFDDIEIERRPDSSGEDMEEIEVTEEKRQGPPPPPSPEHAGGKRLFRNPENAMLGGVCSGLAAYLNADPTWIRLIAILLFFLSASTVSIVYLVLWVVLPPAVTPLEQMQMYGREPTFTNIANTVKEMYNNVRDNATTQFRQYNTRSTGSRIMSNILRALMIIVGIILCPILIAIAAILVAAVAVVFKGLIYGMPVDVDGVYLTTGAIWSYLALAVGACVMIGVPLTYIVIFMFSNARRRFSRRTGISMLCAGLIGTFIFFGGLISCLENSYFDRSTFRPVSTTVEKFKEVTVKMDTVLDATDEIEDTDSTDTAIKSRVTFETTKGTH